MHERKRCSGGCACHVGALAQAGQPHLIAGLLSLPAVAGEEFRNACHAYACAGSPPKFSCRPELLVRGMRRILEKFMKDSVVRGRLLQLLYERRDEGSIPFGHVEQAVPPPGGISRRDWLRAVAQLSEYGLIDWTSLEDKSGMGQLSGFAKINDFGVQVVEGGVAPPIRTAIDKSRRGTVPKQQQASVATSNSQQRKITQALEKVIAAINQADLSEKEKNEAKSSLRKLLSSKAAAKVLGAGAQSLSTKYFTG